MTEPRRVNTHDHKLQRELKKKIIERDGEECIMCRGQKSLHIHHIETWKNNESRRYDPSNCIFLCYYCHKDTYGKEAAYEGIFKNHVASRLHSDAVMRSYDDYLREKYEKEYEQTKENPEV